MSGCFPVCDPWCMTYRAKQCSGDPRRYRVIVVDPPWETTAGPLRGREGFSDAYTGPSRPLAYPTLSVNRIAGLPVPDLALRDCAMFLWTTNGYLPHAFEVLKTWGFEYSTTLVWAKAPMGFGLGGAFGITTEFVLYARRGNPEPRQRTSGTWFNWKRPYDDRGKPWHSAKPPQLQDLIDAMFDGPKLEMFARSQRLGWESWGNEALNHVDLDAAQATGRVAMGMLATPPPDGPRQDQHVCFYQPLGCPCYDAADVPPSGPDSASAQGPGAS